MFGNAIAIVLRLSSSSSTTIQVENEFEMHEIQNEFLRRELVKNRIVNLEMCWVILTDSPKNYRSMVFNNKFIFYFWEVTLHNLDSQHLLFRCQMQTVHSKSSCDIKAN